MNMRTCSAFIYFLFYSFHRNVSLSQRQRLLQTSQLHPSSLKKNMDAWFLREPCGSFCSSSEIQMLCTSAGSFLTSLFSWVLDDLSGTLSSSQKNFNTRLNYWQKCPIENPQFPLLIYNCVRFSAFFLLVYKKFEAS